MSFRVMRIRAGMTQTEVANALNVDRSSITHWERGDCLPRAVQLPKIAKLFGCTVDDLLKQEKEC